MKLEELTKEEKEIILTFYNNIVMNGISVIPKKILNEVKITLAQHLSDVKSSCLCNRDVKMKYQEYLYQLIKTTFNL